MKQTVFISYKNIQLERVLFDNLNKIEKHSSKAPDETILQNIYSWGMVSWKIVSVLTNF